MIQIIIDRARISNAIYTLDEIKEEILNIMRDFTDFEDLGNDCETTLPKMKVKGFLSKTHFPIYLIIIEDEKNKTRMIKTLWTDLEEVMQE